MRFQRLFVFVFLVTICMVLVIWWLAHRHPEPPDVVADFADRAITHVVPRNFLGSGGVGSTLSNATGIKLITDANLRGNRIWAAINLIFPSGDTPNYSLIDAQIDRGTQAGLDPIIVLDGTPPSLGPSPCSMPSSPEHWGQLATTFVQHEDGRHPNLRYEIWNEPDATKSFCPPSDPLGNYLKILNAAASQISHAVPRAKIGGPALAAPANNAATWIPAILSPPTAQYMQFFSFHLYITGTWMLPDMDWDDLYAQTQSLTAGVAYYYRLVEGYVRQGQQPFAAWTPIYVDEYNTNYAYQVNCCQNHHQYGPLWNAVVITDFLNVSHEGAQPPGRLVYFAAADANDYFCLIADPPPGGDYSQCLQQTGSNYVPYPSLLTYELFAKPDMLDIEDGAGIAGPVTVPEGLLATAFFSRGGDALVIVNPTSSPRPGLRVKMQRPGLTHPHATLFSLADAELVKSGLHLSRDGDGYSATIDLPAYATAAIRLSY